MDEHAIPPDLRVRLRAPDRAALATITKAIAAPHRAPPNLTDAVRAALEIAAGSLAGQAGSR